MRIVQLMASPFFGGPERQMLGLALSLPREFETIFLSFAEHGLAQAFLDEAHRCGFQAIALRHNTPHLWAAARELAAQLRRLDADVLCCNGYKPDIIGLLAARQVGLPVVSVSHGWTAATARVKLYEAVDRTILRWMDCTVCVSANQAERVASAGVPRNRVRIIHNAIEVDAVDAVYEDYGEKLHSLFRRTPRVIVAAAGRLSPEKGFAHLVEAAAICRRSDLSLGFVLFGDGPLRDQLEKEIAAHKLHEHFVLAGFRSDWLRFLPHVDLVAMPSFTEGLPVVLLEAFAAGVPVVASAVGGIPEVVEDHVNGYLVPAGDSAALATRILDLAASKALRKAFGAEGRQRVRDCFSREAQSAQYQELFEELTAKSQQHTHSLVS